MKRNSLLIFLIFVFLNLSTLLYSFTGYDLLGYWTVTADGWKFLMHIDTATLTSFTGTFEPLNYTGETTTISGKFLQSDVNNKIEITRYRTNQPPQTFIGYIFVGRADYNIPRGNAIAGEFIHEPVKPNDWRGWYAEKNTNDKVNNINNSIPENFDLMQNYPNPFNPSTTIEFSIQKSSRCHIQICNTSGRLVKVLLNESKIPGEYSIIWDGTDEFGDRVPTGTYIYKLIYDGKVKTKKAIYLK